MNDVSRSRGPGTEQTSPSDYLTPNKSAWSSDFWWLSSVGLITVTLCLPFIRYIGWLFDEGVFLHGAERMLRGDRLYLDFFEFLPPGSFIITEAWFAVGGMSMLSARTLVIATIVGIACFTYLACRRASKSAPLSALIAVVWVVVLQGVWMQVSHHYFTTLFSMIAAWATLASVDAARPRLPGALIAAIAAGAAVVVTPHRGALAMVAAATPFANVQRYWGELIVYCLGAALVPTCMIAYLAWQGALTAAYEDVIVFTATRYASIAGVPFGFMSDIHLRWIFPLAGLITLLACIRDGHECLHDRMFRTCAAFGLAGLIGCFPHPDVVHIGIASPLVCPLLAYCVRQLTRRWQPIYRYAAAALAIASLIPPARSFWWMSHNALRAEIVPMPLGRVWLPMRGARELAERIAVTPADDAYFFYPAIPLLAFLTGRQHVSKYDVFAPQYTLPSQYKEACVAVMQSATWVVIDRNWTDPKTLTANFPAMRDPEPRETKRFLQALETGFELVAREGEFELRRRVSGADETLCIGITE